MGAVTKHELVIRSLASRGASVKGFKCALMEALLSECQGVGERVRAASASALATRRRVVLAAMREQFPVTDPEPGEPELDSCYCEQHEIAALVKDCGLVPDAWAIRLDERAVEVFEVEDTSRMTARKLDKYAELYWALDAVYWTLQVVPVTFRGALERDFSISRYAFSGFYMNEDRHPFWDDNPIDPGLPSPAAGLPS